MTAIYWANLDKKTRLSLIQRFWGPDRSAAQIADDISIELRSQLTRNAVIGYYNRYPKDLANHPLRRGTVGKRTKNSTSFRSRQEAPRQIAIDEIARHQNLVARKALVPPADSPPAYEPEPPLILDPSKTVDLMGLGYGICKFPVSTDPFMFCGMEAGAKSYCPVHDRLAHMDH